jgi:predicted Zn-dependent protease
MADAHNRRRSGGGFGTGSWAIIAGVAAVAAAAGIWFLTQQKGPSAGTPDPGEAAACFAGGDLECAEADYRGLLAKHPDDPDANQQLALTLAREGKDKDALAYFQHAVQLGPVSYGFDEKYAASLRKLGDLDGAIRLDQAALDLRPMLNDIRARLADEMAQAGRYPDAIALLAAYDKEQTDNYNHPVFTAQIAKLQAQMANAPTNAAPANAAPANAARP